MKCQNSRDSLWRAIAKFVDIWTDTTPSSPWCFFKKMGYSRPLFRFKQTFLPIFTANKCEKCPSSIRCWDSNPRPEEHKSPSITNRSSFPVSCRTPRLSPILLSKTVSLHEMDPMLGLDAVTKMQSLMKGFQEWQRKKDIFWVSAQKTMWPDG